MTRFERFRIKYSAHIGGLALCFFSYIAPAVGYEVISVPSGARVDLHEVLFEPEGAEREARQLIRLRFVVPQLVEQEAFGFEKIENDFKALCETQGLDIARSAAPNADQVIVSLSSEKMVFGETAPNVVQYFDAFRIESGTCIWEG